MLRDAFGVGNTIAVWDGVSYIHGECDGQPHCIADDVVVSEWIGESITVAFALPHLDGYAEWLGDAECVAKRERIADAEHQWNEDCDTVRLSGRYPLSDRFVLCVAQ